MSGTAEGELDLVRQRLAVARERFDFAAMIGAAKELVEAAAKTVLAARGVKFTDGIKAPVLITKALETLEIPAHRLDPGEQELAKAANGLYDAADALFTLRHRVGTGHGRAATRPVSDDLTYLAVEAAELWSKWALHRLAIIEDGDVERLISDLLTGRTFYSGTLAQRMATVRLVQLAYAEQERLGQAVAHRCREYTHVVIKDGLEAVVENSPAWPLAYRRGLAHGLVFNRHGQIHPVRLPDLAVLAASMPHDDWLTVVTSCGEAAWAPLLVADLSLARDVGAEIRSLAVSLPIDRRAAWLQLDRDFTADG